jgi:hypothetical protein
MNQTQNLPNLNIFSSVLNHGFKNQNLVLKITDLKKLQKTLFKLFLRKSHVRIRIQKLILSLGLSESLLLLLILSIVHVLKVLDFLISNDIIKSILCLSCKSMLHI